MDVGVQQRFSFVLAVCEGSGVEGDHPEQGGFNVLDRVQAEFFPQVQARLRGISFIVGRVVRLDGIGQQKIIFAHALFLMTYRPPCRVLQSTA
ncbi:hypothetical protein D3C76_1654490 [compost metagenome]